MKKWNKHEGLGIPIGEAQMVKVLRRNGDEWKARAGYLDWAHYQTNNDIMYFRAVSNKKRKYE